MALKMLVNLNKLRMLDIGLNRNWRLSLEVSSCGVSPEVAEVNSCHGILDISYNMIFDEGAAYLVNFPSLKYVNISECGVIDYGEPSKKVGLVIVDEKK